MVSDIPAALVVLVDFKAIYPGVPHGIFTSFPGVAHFLSFEQICQYPRVSRKSTGYPGVLFPRGRPRGKSKYPGVNSSRHMAECHHPALQNTTFVQSWASKQASKGFSNNILKNTNGFFPECCHLYFFTFYTFRP